MNNLYNAAKQALRDVTRLLSDDKFLEKLDQQEGPSESLSIELSNCLSCLFNF